MIEDIQLAAAVADGVGRTLYRLPLTRPVQSEIAALWDAQLTSFLDKASFVKFDAAYTPEDEERFQIEDYVAPDWLTAINRATVVDLDPLDRHEDVLGRIKGLLGFAKQGSTELVLSQNFSRSHLIRPGFSLFLQAGTYTKVDRPGITFGDRLAGVFYPNQKRLIFASFRSMNTIVPMTEFYREASEAEVRSVLEHEVIAAEDIDALSHEPTQWMRKRFALLRDSSVLQDFTPKQIQSRGKKYGVPISVSKGKLVFPADKDEAKRLLQFLNEELFRGAITDRMFSTNSKRAEE